VYRNPYHILDVRVFKRLGDNYELFAGVDNALDEYNLELNPERPKFYYFGLRVTYAGASEPAAP
jgi:outer membrane receptor for ferrienterochelin and colicins